MFERIISFSIRNKLIVLIMVFALAGAGIWSLGQLAIDAIPDITNNQVQVVTSSPTLAPQEIEQMITFPLESKLMNLPGVVEVRSISRFGLSVITVVFEDKVPMLQARQLVGEQLSAAKAEIPDGLGSPELMPITTGLGEIYQYILRVKPGYEHVYDNMDLRTIQDWIVKRQLAGTKGIIEISSFGGFVKQYQVSIDPVLLRQHQVSMDEVFEALETNNENSGGSYIERDHYAYYLRTDGRAKSIEDLENIVVRKNGDTRLRIRDVAKVEYGYPNRYGAMTFDGKGEVVGGITLMLKGANSSDAIRNVHDRVAQIQKSLPQGIEIYPYMDRSVLVKKTTSTVMKNLIEGGLIVVFVLVLLLGNFRAGLIVASMIPLAMLFAFILMNLFGVSANLMSLGAIDFGIVVDGAVIIVESVMHVLHKNYLGKKLTRDEMEEVVVESSHSIIQSAAFGVLIILLVFVPIMTLTGIEGKMFKPMAQTVSFALIGALLLSLTYVPMMSAIFMKRKIHAHENFSDKLVNRIKRVYRPLLEKSLSKPRLVITTALLVLFGSVGLFMTMGGEFIPTLEEGDLAMQMTLKPGSSLQESVKKTNQAEAVLLKNFPEVKHVVAKIGTAEVPTDPMAMEDCDIMIIMKDKDEWTTASTREEMVEKMKEKLSVIKGVNFEFSQPIQLRFNELMTGAKTDVSVKIFGENMDTLKKYADKAAEIIKHIEGAGDVKVEQTEGLLQWRMRLKYDRLGQYHIDVTDVNRVIRTAFAGEQAGVIYENERKFDVVVRMSTHDRVKAELSSIYVNNPDGQLIPLSELVELVEEESPMLISREDAKRRINIGVNVRNRDVASLVEEIDQSITAKVKLPSGYSVKYGGQFENLEKAKQRLSIAVPVALLLIFVLLYFAFGSFKYATLVFAAVPLSAIGGIVALWLRDMPFSISAGVGFIALFGVAVLNGIVLISYFNQLKEEGQLELRGLIVEGGLTRLRPVIMTAAVASLGFLPMALSNSSGAEVQKPLATVVIGGLVSATILTLLVLPVIYFLAEQKRKKGVKVVAGVVILLFMWPSYPVNAQQVLTKTQAIEHAWANHPRLKNAGLQVKEIEAGTGQNKTLAPLEIVFQQGQINYAERDYYIEANQNLGNFVSWFRLDERMRMQVLEAKSQEQLLRKEIALKVSLAYAEWKYSEANIREIDSLVLLFSEAQKRMEKRKSIGDADPLEYGFLLVQMEEIQNRKVLAQLSLEQARRQLKWEAWLPDSLFAPATEDPKLSEENTWSVDSVLLSAAAGKISIQEAETRYLKSQYAPDWMIGYFNQSLEQQDGYWGVRAGISIPLWSWNTSSKIKQSQLRQEMLSNELNMLQTQLQLDLQQYITQEKSLSQRMSTLGKSSAEMHGFKTAALSKYLAGDIPFFAFVQAMNVYFQNRMAQLQLELEWENIQSHITFLTTNA